MSIRGAVNVVNFVNSLCREPVSIPSLLCSLGKFIKDKGFRPEGGSGGCRSQTPQEVHNVHNVHRPEQAGGDTPEATRLSDLPEWMQAASGQRLRPAAVIINVTTFHRSKA